MHNLLTGKKYDRMVTDSAPSVTVEKPWTAEKYLSAMRRLLNEAGKPGNHTETYIAAAGVLAKAATAAAISEDFMDAPPATGGVPGDGDTVR